MQINPKDFGFLVAFKNELLKVQKEVTSSHSKINFLGDQFKIGDPKSCSQFFLKATNKVGDLFSSYPLLDQKDLGKELKEMRQICRDMYSVIEKETEKTFKLLFNKNEIAETKKTFDHLDKLLESLENISAYCFSIHDENTDNPLETKAIESLRNLKEESPTIAKALVKKYPSTTLDHGISKLWRSLKTSNAQHTLEKIDDNLSLKKEVNESTNHRIKRLKNVSKSVSKFESALLKSDLNTDEGRKQLGKQMKSLGYKFFCNLETLEKFQQKKDLKTTKENFKAQQTIANAVSQMLDEYKYLPTTFKDLTKDHHTERIKKFTAAFRSLSDLDPMFAEKFLKKLANQNDHKILMMLCKSNLCLDLSKTPIHIRLLEAFVSMRGNLKEVKVSEIMGDKTEIDLSKCPAKAAVPLLKMFSNELKKISISSEIFLSKEFQAMKPKPAQNDRGDDINNWGDDPEYEKKRLEKYQAKPGHIFPQVGELRILAGDEKHVSAKLKQVETLLQIFPSCHYADLPPLFLPDIKGTPLGSLGIHGWFDFHDLAEVLSSCDERFHHAIVNSFLLTDSLDGDQLENLNYYQRDHHLKDVSPVHYLLLLAHHNSNTAAQAYLIGKFRQRDWQQAASLLLGAGKFEDFILPTSKEWNLGRDEYMSNKEKREEKKMRTLIPTDFSNNPLLTDKQLTGFLQCQDSSKLTNAQKIFAVCLSNCENISNKGVRSLIEQCSFLDAIELKNNPQIDDRALMDIPEKHLSHLEFLDLRGTSVSSGCIKNLEKKFPEMRIYWDSSTLAVQKLYHERDKSGDLAIQSGGKSLPIHKENILPLVKNTDLQGVDKNQKPTLSLPMEISEKSLEILIDYLYSGTLKSLDTATAFQLMELGLHPDMPIPILVQDCRQWLIRTMTPDNVADRYRQAMKLGARAVADGACRFIDLVLNVKDSILVEPLSKNELKNLQKILKEHEEIALSWLDKDNFNIRVEMHISSLPVEISEKSMDVLRDYLNRGILREIDVATAFELIKLGLHQNTPLPFLVAQCQQRIKAAIKNENAVAIYHQAVEMGIRTVADKAYAHIEFHHSSRHLPKEFLEQFEYILKEPSHLSILIPEPIQEQPLRFQWTAKIEDKKMLRQLPPELHSQGVEQLKKIEQKAVEERIKEEESPKAFKNRSSILNGNMGFQRGKLNGIEALSQHRIESDGVLEVIFPQSSSSTKIPINRTLLASRSEKFKEFLEKHQGNTTISIDTKRPEAFVTITEALMRGQELSIENIPLEKLIDLLKEADKYGVTEQVIGLESVRTWIYETTRNGADNIHWLDLLKWTKKHDHAAGILFVLLYSQLFENGKLQEPWRSQPITAKTIRGIVRDENFQHYHKLLMKGERPKVGFMTKRTAWSEHGTDYTVEGAISKIPL